MSAELLREAAREMRKQAKAARASLSDNVPEWHSVQALMGEGKTEGDAEHIASWHPAVALAVADLLDAIANENDSPEGSRLAFLDFIDAPAMAAASLAHLYLGAER